MPNVDSSPAGFPARNYSQCCLQGAWVRSINSGTDPELVYLAKVQDTDFFKFVNINLASVFQNSERPHLVGGTDSEPIPSYTGFCRIGRQHNPVVPTCDTATRGQPSRNQPGSAPGVVRLAASFQAIATYEDPTV